MDAPTPPPGYRLNPAKYDSRGNLRVGMDKPDPVISYGNLLLQTMENFQQYELQKVQMAGIKQQTARAKAETDRFVYMSDLDRLRAQRDEKGYQDDLAYFKMETEWEISTALAGTGDPGKLLLYMDAFNNSGINTEKPTVAFNARMGQARGKFVMFWDEKPGDYEHVRMVSFPELISKIEDPEMAHALLKGTSPKYRPAVLDYIKRTFPAMEGWVAENRPTYLSSAVMEAVDIETAKRPLNEMEQAYAKLTIALNETERKVLAETKWEKIANSTPRMIALAKRRDSLAARRDALEAHAKDEYMETADMPDDVKQIVAQREAEKKEYEPLTQVTVKAAIAQAIKEEKAIQTVGASPDKSRLSMLQGLQNGMSEDWARSAPRGSFLAFFVKGEATPEERVAMSAQDEALKLGKRLRDVFNKQDALKGTKQAASWENTYQGEIRGILDKVKIPVTPKEKPSKLLTSLLKELTVTEDEMLREKELIELSRTRIYKTERTTRNMPGGAPAETEFGTPASTERVILIDSEGTERSVTSEEARRIMTARPGEFTVK